MTEPRFSAPTGQQRDAAFCRRAPARGSVGSVGEVDPSFVLVAAGREGCGEINTARSVSADQRWMEASG
jgi:hypothetical protein